MKTTVKEGYEILYDANRPMFPWSEIEFIDGSMYWRDGGKVDLNELTRLGYIRKYRITETKEYL